MIHRFSARMQKTSNCLSLFCLPFDEICLILILWEAMNCKTWSTFSFLAAYVVGESSNFRASPAEKVRKKDIKTLINFIGPNI